MRILLASILLSMLSIAAFAQSDGRTTNNTANTTGNSSVSRGASNSISGRVTDGERGVGNIAVLVLPGDYTLQRTTIAKATTDAEGRYQIANIPAGKYHLMAIAPNYTADDLDRFRGKQITLGSDEAIDGINFSITRGGVITGKIVHHDGRPVIEQRIDLMRVDENGRKVPITVTNYLSMVTDDRGIYRIFGLPPGKYQLSVGETSSPNRARVSLNSSRLPLTFYPSVVDEEKAELITVEPAGETSGIDLTIGRAERSYKVTGRVIDSDTGKPLAGVRLGYGILGESGHLLVGSNGIRSDTRGEFQLIGLLPGSYGITAFSEGNFNFYSDKTPFEVSNGDINGVEVKIRRGGSVQGIVSFESDTTPEATRGLSQLELIARVHSTQGEPDTSWVNPSRINGDGTFKFVGIPPGNLEILLSQSPKPNGYAIKRIERNGLILGDDLEVAAGQHINDLSIVLTYGNCTIKGQVKLLGDVPTQRRLFVIYKSINSESKAREDYAEVDSLGRFTLERLTAGDYELLVRVLLPGRTPLSSPKQTVTVTNGATVEANINFDLNSKGNNDQEQEED